MIRTKVADILRCGSLYMEFSPGATHYTHPQRLSRQFVGNNVAVPMTVSLQSVAHAFSIGLRSGE